ncbi:transcriptional regulator, AraC family with amidase-like domain [Trichlorobacter thiogenes]|uniref:Transcriptional regulator, AraC family with amidase-like domain n=1 Tax=Trichlorobacter thiogenes TaxID=115783 RepID=A0A1T4KCC1_9BACT|nr:helix-turn-helix domain-containing protein [Trichlorobacter thiogenes]SJZ40098.1 transcriptional regulator, AraC family with amidase-like domain [Trichlorobacter thiogenes]
MQAETIAVIAFDQISPFLLAMPCTVFRDDPTRPDGPRFKLLVCSAEKRTMQSSAGFAIQTRHTLKDAEQADIVIVPSWRDPQELPPQRLLDCLQAAHKRGALVVGLCLGTYVLAAAGLLNGRPATTHWGWTEDLRQRYPQITLKPDVLYVDDGDIVTSAGVAAGIDCCLHLLRRLHGAETAAHVARRMVVPPHRQGGQAQFIELPVTRSAAEDRFGQNLEWLQLNLDQSHSLDSLAERFMMSRRTFTRRFRQVASCTVGAWLLNQRLALAQRLLETTAKPIDLIAQEAGFGSEAALRQQFSKVLKTSPARYRREFRGSRTTQ